MTLLENIKLSSGCIGRWCLDRRVDSQMAVLLFTPRTDLFNASSHTRRLEAWHTASQLFAQMAW